MRRNTETFKMENLYKKHSKNLIKIQVKCMGRDFMHTCVDPKTGEKWSKFVSMENIYLCDKNLKNQCLGWYNFGCFKKIKYVYVLPLDGRLYYFLEPEKLLDKRALKKFVENEDFKNKKYAFINYGLYKKCYMDLVKNKKLN